MLIASSALPWWSWVERGLIKRFQQDREASQQTWGISWSILDFQPRDVAIYWLVDREAKGSPVALQKVLLFCYRNPKFWL